MRGSSDFDFRGSGLWAVILGGSSGFGLAAASRLAGAWIDEQLADDAGEPFAGVTRHAITTTELVDSFDRQRFRESVPSGAEVRT